MKKYIVATNETSEFESNSRDAKKHLRENGGDICNVYNKSGKLISQARNSAEFGIYSCTI